ncbi:MAG: ribosomal protein S18-alanine N-acetyltransferase [Lachnospiraceae bacterium]
MVQIDKLTAADLEQVSRMEQECFSMPWSEKSFEEILDNPKAVYVVAREDEQVIGYCGAYLILDEADINQVAVAPAHREKGVGRMMMTALMERLKQAGAESVTLEVRKSNIPAIALYEGLGFRTEGIRKNFYEKPAEDALIMWKR